MRGRRGLLRLFLFLLFLAPSGAGAQPIHGGLLGQFAGILELPPPLVTGPTDLRFFGTFCQPSPKEFCKSIPVLPDPCVTLRDLRLRLDHLTEPTGGVLRGSGDFVLDGENGVLAVAASVSARGAARFSAVAPGLGSQQGDATLSADGLELVAATQGRAIKLRKDACGNNAPVVTLQAPFGPTFPFGQTVMLSADIVDEDSPDFPAERIVFTSNRQGLISGQRPANRTIFATNLLAGSHQVTVTVTDSGGLAGQGSLDIEVLNRPPGTPRIFLPAAGATLVAGGPVLLEGNAIDPDAGFLSGSALTWSAQVTPGGPFQTLGSGSSLMTSFAAPADPVVIRLTASDGVSQAHAEHQVRVVDSTGNTPPVVVIRQPDRLQSSHPQLAWIMIAGEANAFLATALDAEDMPPDLETRWTFEALEGLGGAPDPTPPVPNPAPVTDTLAPAVTFTAAAGGVYYRVTFEATDSGGLISSDSVQISVSSSGPIL
ncbi:MAG: hypothetical protein ACRD0X_00595 [Thermoanaerobaculia bacterium]